MQEESRELKEEFSVCKCSNCAPEEAKVLREKLTVLQLDNFDAALDNPNTLPEVLETPPIKKTVKSKHRKELNAVLDQLVDTLIMNFNSFFSVQYKVTLFLPSKVFSPLEANLIA
jgi:hypothetical protein